MPNKIAKNKRNQFSVAEFCDSIINTNFYQKIKTTPKQECFRILALDYFNSVTKNKCQLRAITNRCRHLFRIKAIDIENFFETHFNGPKLDFPKKFNLQFTYYEVFEEKNKFNFNLRNNIFDKFQKINHICNGLQGDFLVNEDRGRIQPPA